MPWLCLFTYRTCTFLVFFFPAIFSTTFLNSLSQCLSFKLSRITCLVGKKRLNFYLRAHWLSETIFGEVGGSHLLLRGYTFRRLADREALGEFFSSLRLWERKDPDLLGFLKRLDGWLARHGGTICPRLKAIGTANPPTLHPQTLQPSIHAASPSVWFFEVSDIDTRREMAAFTYDLSLGAV